MMSFQSERQPKQCRILLHIYDFDYIIRVEKDPLAA